MKKILFFSILFLTISFFANRYLSKPILTAEIRGNENGPIGFDEDWDNIFHFILKAVNKDVAVYEEWNSWGYFTRSFLAQDKDNPKLNYVIKRWPRGWDHNFASTQMIKKGDVFITDINLCDGTWEIYPKLPTTSDLHLFLKGQYDVTESDEPSKFAVDSVWGKAWYGHLVTNIVEITIHKGCIDPLNNPPEWGH